MVLLVFGPTAGRQIEIGAVVRPTGPLAEPPFSLSQVRTSQCLKQAPIECLKIAVLDFLRTTTQEYRQSHAAALELPLVKQLGPRQGGKDDGGSERLPMGKRRRGSWFIVVLNEPHQFFL